MSKADAIMTPGDYAAGGTLRIQLERIATEFRPVLGWPPVIHRKSLSDGRWLVVADINATAAYPEGHPLAGRPRYDWTPRPDGDGVLYGTLKPA